MSDVFCRGCGYTLTWQEQRRQQTRLERDGKSKDEREALLPRCRKCLTSALVEKCLECGVPIGKERLVRGWLRRLGKTADEIEALMPRCRRCLQTCVASTAARDCVAPHRGECVGGR